MFLYHYTNPEVIPLVKKYGLFSLHYLCTKSSERKQYCYNALKGYKERVAKYFGKEPKIYEDYEKYFKVRGGIESIKGIFFLFKDVTLSINKERDDFIRKGSLVKLPTKYLEKNWRYSLVYRGKISDISIEEVLNYCKMDLTNFEKKPSKPFLFSYVPHLRIITNDGKIKPNKLIIG